MLDFKQIFRRPDFLALWEKTDARLPILFIHIPKTAGTSFRVAAQESRRVAQVLQDYGPKKQATNAPGLHRARYPEEDASQVRAFLEDQRNYVLSGHFRADRYLRHFYPYQIISFVRDPIERVVSAYHHATRVHNYRGSLNDFVQTPRGTNHQPRQLSPLPPIYYGFIGITEQFNESIDLINSAYGLRLKTKRSNTNPQKPHSERYRIDPDLKALIAERNTRDRDLYALASRILATRKQYSDSGSQLLYGSYSFEDEKQIVGRAYRAWSDEPVSLSLTVNGQVLGQTQASLHNPIPCPVKQPRSGHIGFRFSLDQALSETDQVEIVETESGQPIEHHQESP